MKDSRRKTLQEMIWDWQKEYWFRAKIYRPDMTLDRVKSVNDARAPKNDDEDGGLLRFVSRNHIFYYDKTQMFREDGINKGIFIEGIIDQVSVKSTDKKTGMVKEIKLENPQVALPIFEIPPIDAITFLQRLQTQWSLEMFKGSGMLVKILKILSVTVIMLVVIIVLAAASVIKGLI